MKVAEEVPGFAIKMQSDIIFDPVPNVLSKNADGKNFWGMQRTSYSDNTLQKRDNLIKAANTLGVEPIVASIFKNTFEKDRCQNLFPEI